MPQNRVASPIIAHGWLYEPWIIPSLPYDAWFQHSVAPLREENSVKIIRHLSLLSRECLRREEKGWCWCVGDKGAQLPKFRRNFFIFIFY